METCRRVHSWGQGLDTLNGPYVVSERVKYEDVLRYCHSAASQFRQLGDCEYTTIGLSPPFVWHWLLSTHSPTFPWFARRCHHLQGDKQRLPSASVLLLRCVHTHTHTHTCPLPILSLYRLHKHPGHRS